jgi:hypothetical protein
MACLRLHKKPKAEMHPGHMLKGPKEEEEEKCISWCMNFSELTNQLTNELLMDRGLFLRSQYFLN